MTAVATDSVVHLNEASFAGVVNSGKPVIVDFWAEWCGPCRMIGPVLEEIAADYAGRAVVAKVNVDDNYALAQQYGISAIPNVKIFKGGKVVEDLVGAMPKAAYEKALAKHL